MSTSKQKRKYPRVQTKVSQSTQTKQQFKDECDINKIMQKYERTNALEHLNNREAQYGYATGDTFQESMELIATGQTMFEELPAHLRKKFHHSPEEFLNFVQDENNLKEMRSLGLAHPEGQDQYPEELNGTPAPGKDAGKAENPKAANADEG